MSEQALARVGMERRRLGGVPVPPGLEFYRGGFPFRRLIRFEKVDDELIEFLIVEPVVMAHPVGGVAQREVQLRQV